MKTLGNVIWIVFDIIALMITIVGIPFGIQSLMLAEMALWPF
jgi:uncharacterized membrane protein YccF (DUF307 family)